MSHDSPKYIIYHMALKIYHYETKNKIISYETQNISCETQITIYIIWKSNTIYSICCNSAIPNKITGGGATKKFMSVGLFKLSSNGPALWANISYETQNTKYCISYETQNTIYIM